MGQPKQGHRRLAMAVTVGFLACQQAPLGRPAERIDEPWIFADGERIERVQLSPREPVPGRTLELRWWGSKKAQQGLTFVLVPGRDAAWQHYPRVRAKQWFSSRALRGLSDATTGRVQFDIPSAWQDRTATVMAYRTRGEGMIPLHAGARAPSSDPPHPDAARLAILAVVPLAAARRELVAPLLPKGQIKIDGQDDDWPGDVPAYALVHSIDGAPVLRDGTQVSFAWDPTHLYLRAIMRDRDLWAPHQTRDDPVYRKEAIEVFIGADGSGTDYLELGLSAANVVYDARFTRPRAGTSSYDGRWVHAVTVQGSLNDPSDRDRGWVAELALPWVQLCAMARVYCPVTPGTQIRVNVFRVESPHRRAQRGTALSALGRPDFHAMDQAAFLRLTP